MEEAERTTEAQRLIQGYNVTPINSAWSLAPLWKVLYVGIFKITNSTSSISNRTDKLLAGNTFWSGLKNDFSY